MRIPLRILIIDDNPADYTILERHLKDLSQWSIECFRWDSGAMALEKSLDIKPDITFVDYMLGDKTGTEVVHALKNKGCDSSFVLLTGMAGEEAAVQGLREGVDDYISKAKLSPERLGRTLRFVAERRRVEKALGESNEQVRMLLDSTAESIFGLDLDGNCTFANASCVRSLGYKEAEKLVGMNMHALVHYKHADGSDYPEGECKIAKAFRDGGGTYVNDEVMWRSDGTCFLVEYRSYPVWRDEKVVGAVVTFTDITERKKAEQDLNLAAEVFENCIEGIVVTGPDAVIQNVNPAFTTITGYSREEVIGRKTSILRSEKHDIAFYKSMWSSLINTGQWAGEIWNRKKSGEAYPGWQTISSVKNSHGETLRYVGVFSDVTESKLKDEKIKYQAYHDPLTGLPNRTLLEDRLKQAVRRAHRHDKNLALLFIDLDNFKNVNDTFGHSYGDVLLQEAAKRMKACLRENDTVARIGGDEFTVILEDARNGYDATVVAHKIIESLTSPIKIKEHETFIGASIGITIYPGDGDDVETLIKNADMAMYKAKEEGKNNFQLYTPEMNEKIAKRFNLENNLRRALERDEFLVYYQPKVDLLTNAIVGAEALVRWDRPSEGIVSPADFIPVAEDTGLILPLGEKVLRESCMQLKKWHDSGFENLTVSVNLSARQFRQSDLAGIVMKVLSETGLDPECLELEITETVVMHDVKKAIGTMESLGLIGVKFSVDDFGTGYSSLNYLKRFPINTLKIDRSFVHELSNSTDDAAIVAVIIAMARSLSLNVIAEGVETAKQLAFLREHNCDEIQGYIFSPPTPPEVFYELLREKKSLSDTNLPPENHSNIGEVRPAPLRA